MWSPEGKTLGTYLVHERIGQGGMATVYRAQHLRLGSDAAIKILAINLSGQDHFLLRFQREASSVAALQHPNILSVWDYGEQEGLAYMVMPYVRGGTLRDRLTRGPLTPTEMLDYLGQLAEALDYAHERGLVHRDVKPANVLLDGRGHLYLADFGIAKALEGSEGLTSTGMGVGTPEYMAPEQAQGRADRRADLYALGIITYQLLTGRVPYSGNSSVEVLMQHLSAPIPLAPLRGRVPEAVEGVLLRALAKDPDQRYQTAQGFVAALNAALQADGRADMAATVMNPAFPTPTPTSTPTPAPGWATPLPASSTPNRATPAPMPGPTPTPGWATPLPTATPSPAWGTPVPTPAPGPGTNPTSYPLAGPAPTQTAGARSRGWLLGLAIGAVVLVGLCSAGSLGVYALTRPDGNATATARTGATVAAFVVQRTGTANVVATATALVPTATPIPPTSTPPPPTNTPLPTNTAVPPTATRPPTPTATRPPTAPPVVPTPSGGYGANFSTWSSEPGADYRRGLDVATGEYRVAITSKQTYSFFATDAPPLADFTLEVDAHRISGPDTTAYGLAFRVQKQGANDKASTRLIFYITPEGSFGLYLVNADGTTTTVQAKTSQRAVNVGDQGNRLSVAAKGDKVTLGINGTSVGTYTVSLVSIGGIGLNASNATGTSEIEVGFKNLRLAPLP